MKNKYGEILDPWSEFQQISYKQGEKDRQRTGDGMYEKYQSITSDLTWCNQMMQEIPHSLGIKEHNSFLNILNSTK